MILIKVLILKSPRKNSYFKSDNVNFIAYSFQNEKYDRNGMLISSDNNYGVYLLQKVEMWDET